MSSSAIVSRDKDEETILKIDKLEDLMTPLEYKFAIQISKNLESNSEKCAERLYEIVDSCRAVTNIGKVVYYPNEDLGRLALKISFDLRSTSETDVSCLLKTLGQVNNYFFNLKTDSRRSLYFSLNDSESQFSDFEVNVIFDLTPQTQFCLYDMIAAAHYIN